MWNPAIADDTPPDSIYPSAGRVPDYGRSGKGELVTATGRPEPRPTRTESAIQEMITGEGSCMIGPYTKPHLGIGISPGCSHFPVTAPHRCGTRRDIQSSSEEF
ncbi:hypothetical protein GX50_01004 [[Emmonsia] crescens]|uniref:Uncharacterized protein n=1 Tax=[Emmonsia] crescens TaxID=73230 RepID=A0A2B7ZSI6_9EURO|nr:hypothetical protein GX50_01004 [Emmonsia crescens]